MSKAIVVHETGGPDVLKFEDRDPGTPGPGEVLIEHTAIGLNFIDVYFRTGLYPSGDNGPFVPGGEAAGKVLDLVDVSAPVFHELERVGIDACISLDAPAPTRAESRSKHPPPGGAGRFMRWLNPTTTIH